ncbi:MAG: biopolymer transporter ExbD [Kiritimatiellae bacterium]|nr:biopolymer transporter ExbD [Kiritimatiellia bacterium]MDD5519175.1 biopolymer transporter ExbD [Kiritimatiellia bacterium]
MAGGGGSEDLPGVNMTAMIDIIFMLVIFFILTVKMEEGLMSEGIMLAMAPHGNEIKNKDPREILVEVDPQGKIRINRTVLSTNTFTRVIAKAVSEYRADTPVVIVADAKVQHKYVRKVMDICSSVGIWKLKFMALKEK